MASDPALPSPPVLDRVSSVRAGARGMLPITVGIAPFGIIAGVAATDAGLGLAEAMGFSVVVLAGAAQLASLDLIGRDAPVLVVIVTALIINLRMLMYSAALAPELAHVSRAKRLLGAYWVTDQTFAVSIVRFRASGQAPVDKWWFYLGSAIPLWVVWQLATAVGVVAGGAVPPTIPLGFALPLAFISLLVPTLTDRPAVVAALSAAVVAVVAAPLPANAGMPLAAITGIAAGWIAAGATGRRAAA
jgi:predicted branched-subunit amino acid permease